MSRYYFHIYMENTICEENTRPDSQKSISPPRCANWSPHWAGPQEESTAPPQPAPLLRLASPSWHSATSFGARDVSKSLHLRNCEIDLCMLRCWEQRKQSGYRLSQMESHKTRRVTCRYRFVTEVLLARATPYRKFGDLLIQDLAPGHWSPAGEASWLPNIFKETLLNHFQAPLVTTKCAQMSQSYWIRDKTNWYIYSEIGILPLYIQIQCYNRCT